MRAGKPLTAVRFYLSALSLITMVRSRLSKRMEEKTRKHLFLSILGIVLVIFLGFKFGIPLLVNLSLFLSGSTASQEQSQGQNPSFIPPPVLDSLPQATSSANLTITGIAVKNQTIELYINDNLIDKADTKDNGSFTFKEIISTGENVIKTKAVDGNNKSEFSQPLMISYRNALPSLNIASPSNGQSFSKDQNVADVKGTTDPDVRIMVNGFRAVTDSNGNFSYKLPLQNGENRIKVAAIDPAGNKSEKEIIITYSP